MDEHWDCLIIGAGPAGLTAAIYLGRFLRRVAVLHNGSSRAALIPTSHNFPGFSDGISGLDLLKDLRRQASIYGAVIEEGDVKEIRQQDGAFSAVTSSSVVTARRLILATGILDSNPEIAGLRGSVFDGQVRYCPICDGYEAMDKTIAVLGPIRSAMRKALFLRTYSSHVAVVTPDTPTAEQQTALGDAGIALHCGHVADIHRGKALTITLAGGRPMSFDTLYPAMGCNIRARLATDLGADTDESGALKVDAHQQTSVKGLYAVGDVVSCLDQMSVGIGHAAIAATAVHNELPARFR